MALPLLGAIALKGWIPKLIGAGVILVILAIGAAAIYYTAYNKGTNVAKVEISDYQRRVSEANARQIEREAKVTERVIERYHTTVRERQPVIYRNTEVIRTTVPTGATLTRGAVYAHDQSARGEAIDPVRAGDSSKSTTNERDLIGVVNENYDIARANSDRHNSLIDWVEQQAKAQENEKANSR